VAVVLQDDGDVYADTRSMFEYGFNNFSKVLLSGEKMPEEIRSYTDSDSYVLLPDGVTFDSLEHEITVEDEKEASGRITFFYKGQNVGSADVVLTPEYVEETTGYTTRLELSNPGAGQDMDTGKSSRALPLSMIMRIAAAGAVILLLFILIIIVVFRRRAAVRRKRRMMIRRKRHQMQQGAGRQRIRNVKSSSARARQPVSSNRNRRRS
jgi:D-alanyl-D-alanine carboxypeptidase